MYIRLFYEEPKITYSALFRNRYTIREGKTTKKYNLKTEYDLRSFQNLEQLLIFNEDGTHNSIETAQYDKDGILKAVKVKDEITEFYNLGEKSLQIQRFYYDEERSTNNFALIPQYNDDGFVKSAKMIDLKDKMVEYEIICERDNKNRLTKEIMANAQEHIEYRYTPAKGLLKEEIFKFNKKVMYWKKYFS